MDDCSVAKVVFMVHIDKTQAQLIEELEGYREQVARLELLAEVSRAVSSTLDMDTILTEIARMCCEALDVTSVYVSTHDIEAMTTTVIAEYIAPTATSKEKVSDLGVVYDLEKDFPLQAKWSHNPTDYYTLQVDDPELQPMEIEHFIEYGEIGRAHV